MSHCTWVSMVVLVLGVGAADSADRERSPDLAVVPKVVRTIPIPNNNDPAGSKRSAEMPTMHDSKAGSEIINRVPGESKLQVAEIKEPAPLPQLAASVHTD